MSGVDGAVKGAHALPLDLGKFQEIPGTVLFKLGSEEKF